MQDPWQVDAARPGRGNAIAGFAIGALFAVLGLGAFEIPNAIANAADRDNPSDPQRAAATRFCNGPVAQLTKSEVLTGGSVDGFMEAVAMHNAWYKKAGYRGNVQMPLLTMGMTGPTPRFENDFVYTLHVMTPFGAERARDPAGWDAYVARYRENVRIMDGALICLAGLEAALQGDTARLVEEALTERKIEFGI